MKLLYSLAFLFISSFAIASGCTPPTITSDPSHKAVCENSDTYFRVIATGLSLTYQWQIDQGSGFVDVVNAPPFSGATTDSLIITTVPASLDNSLFRCIVSNGCVPNDTSSEALLKITGTSSILFQPSDLTGCEGGLNTFTVVAAGTGLTYQWQVNTGSGFVNVPAALPYSGETTSSLSISGTPLTFNGYQFQVLINAGCSSALISSTVTLTLNSLPSITAGPGPMSVCDGGATSTSVIATGSGLSYQWQLNSGSGYSDLSNTSPYSGVTTPTLNINPASLSMSGFTYRCIVSGACSPADTSSPVTLTVYETYSVFTFATICQGEAFVFGASSLTSPGFYSNVLSSTNSCDSIVYLNLTVLPSFFTTTASTICSNDSVLLGGTYVSAPGVYTYVLPALNGCDSTIEHTLSNFPSYLFASMSAVCEGDSVLIFGSYETQDSVYTQHHFTFQGCDSVYTHELNVNPVYDIAVTTYICQGDSTFFGGSYHSTAGVFTFGYTTYSGCDSVVTTTLVVNPSYYITQNISICADDSVFLAGAYQNTTGVYTDSLIAVSDCDSVIVTTLTVGAIPLVSMDFNDSMYCHWDMPLTLTQGSPSGGIYSGPGISGGNIFNPPGGFGTFAITYTYTDTAGCSASSVDSIWVEICEGVEEYLNEADFTVYPNPFADEFTITSVSQEVIEVSVFNVLGESVQALQINKGSWKLDMKDQPAGIYFIELRSGNKILVKKAVKY